MSLAGRQINPIDVNFHLQKSLETFDKKLSWQNLIQKGQGGGKCPASCKLGLRIYVDKILPFLHHLNSSVEIEYLINDDKKLNFIDYLNTSIFQCFL